MPAHDKRSKIVAYYRTSTSDQLLGMEAQQVTVERIASERAWPVVRTFTEHESGGNNQRLELDKAVRYARRIGATVVVAKLDRLARDSQFLGKLYNGDVPIVFGDLPEVDGSSASRVIVQIMASIAEFERVRIGERTKEALARVKAAGKKLGTPGNLKQEHRAKGARISAMKRREEATEHMSDVAELAVPMYQEGATLANIAAYLNQQEYITAKGKAWSTTQVRRVLERVGVPRRGRGGSRAITNG